MTEVSTTNLLQQINELIQSQKRIQEIIKEEDLFELDEIVIQGIQTLTEDIIDPELVEVILDYYIVKVVQDQPFNVTLDGKSVEVNCFQDLSSVLLQTNQ